MSDSKRFHVQNYYTTTATTIPSTVSEETLLGEIVVMATKDNENLFIKNSDGDMVSVTSDGNNMTNVTHKELKTLRDGGRLKPGRKYRITDYVTIINAENKFSDEHPFDIVVTALSEDTLSEEASAIAHEGITFYDNYNLSSWKLWYSIDNDFAKWGLTTQRDGGFISNWGLLNKTGSTTDGDGKEIHLYSANDGGAYWQDKYLTKPEQVTITDVSKIFVAQEDGNDYELYLCAEDDYDIMNGRYLAVLYYQHDDENGNYLFYLDEDYYDGDSAYPLRITSVTDEYVDEDEIFVKVEVSGLEELFNGFYGGEISTTVYTEYSGNYTDLYAAFDRELTVDKPSDRSKLYCTTDDSYYSQYQNSSKDVSTSGYQREVECGKGVIYRMIDEFNNDFPYDFYNIGLIKGDYRYHTFGSDNIYINADTVENLLSISLPFVKDHLLVARFPTNSRNNKIYAPSGFGSIDLGSICWNTNIYISPIGTGDALGTCNIKMVTSFSNNMFIDNNSNITTGMNFYNNSISCRQDFKVGKNFTYNEVRCVNLVIEGDYVSRSSFRGHGKIRIEDSRGNLKASVLNFADVTLRGDYVNGEVLKLVYDGTTGSGIGLTGLVIRGAQFFRGEFAGKERVVTIDPSYTIDSYGPLTIAQNSDGEIVTYCEADLFKA